MVAVPRISIVTPSYNQGAFLPEMLDSIHKQAYPNLEHIVMDGGSTDGTLDQLRQAPPPTTWMSDTDTGQAQAINRGFSIATGTIYGWLNCDDLLVPGALSVVADYFSRHHEAYFLYGDALAIDKRGRSYGLRVNVREGGASMLADEGDFIVQPAAFWRAELWHAVGPLDEDLHFALDYEWFLRAAQRFSLHYLPICLAKERLHGYAKTATGYHKRTEEIKAVAGRYSGQGLPSRFRAEAAALHVADAVSALRDGEVSRSRRHISQAYRLGAQQRTRGERSDHSLRSTWERIRQRSGGILKFLMYIITLAVRGKPGIVTLRLWANRMLCWRRPQYPSVYVRHAPHPVSRQSVSRQSASQQSVTNTGHS